MLSPDACQQVEGKRLSEAARPCFGVLRCVHYRVEPVTGVILVTLGSASPSRKDGAPMSWIISKLTHIVRRRIIETARCPIAAVLPHGRPNSVAGLRFTSGGVNALR